MSEDDMENQDVFHTPTHLTTNLTGLRLYGRSPTPESPTTHHNHEQPRLEQSSSLPDSTTGKEVLNMVKNELLQ